MKILKGLCTVMVLTICLAGISTTALAKKKKGADLSQAQKTVEKISPSQPPKESTGTKKSPEGQPVTDFKPKAKTLKTTEPPPPPPKKN